MLEKIGQRVVPGCCGSGGRPSQSRRRKQDALSGRKHKGLNEQEGGACGGFAVSRVIINTGTWSSWQEAPIFGGDQERYYIARYTHFPSLPSPVTRRGRRLTQMSSASRTNATTTRTSASRLWLSVGFHCSPNAPPRLCQRDRQDQFGAHVSTREKDNDADSVKTTGGRVCTMESSASNP